MNKLSQHRILNISTESSSMFARICEKTKTFYGNTLRLRLLELIPAAVIPASFVCRACLTYEEPREVLAQSLIPCIFFGYLLLVAVFSRIAVVRFTALLIYCIHMAYGFLPPIAKGKHSPGDPLNWRIVLYFVLTIAGFAVIATLEKGPFRVQIHTDRGYVGTVDALGAFFLLIFLLIFLGVLLC